MGHKHNDPITQSSINRNEPVPSIFSEKQESIGQGDQFF